MTRTRIKFLGLAEMALHGARYSNLSHRRGYCTEIQLPPGGWLLHIPCARDKKGGVPVWTATFCCLECSTSTVHTAQRDAHTVWKSVFSGFGVVKNRPCCRSGFCAHLEGAVINPVHERQSISRLSSDWQPRGEHTVILQWGRRGATASGFRARRG